MKRRHRRIRGQKRCRCEEPDELTCTGCGAVLCVECEGYVVLGKDERLVDLEEVELDQEA